MKIKIQITVESDKGQPEVVREVAHIVRGTLRACLKSLKPMRDG
jgi:hypothetical protein